MMVDRDTRSAMETPARGSKGVWILGAILLLIVIALGIWGFVYAAQGTDHDRIANEVTTSDV